MALDPPVWAGEYEPTGFQSQHAGITSKKWTRSQRIRTAALIPFEVAIVDTSPPPTYQSVAADALRLSRLGMSHLKIAQTLGVTDKTVTKALRWLGLVGNAMDAR